MELIVDKSFLDAASREEISEICERYHVMMPDILFFELITTREESRRRCFAKLPDADDPMSLLQGIGELLRYEIATKQPCVPLSEKCLRLIYRFNPHLRDGTFRFAGEALEERDRQKAQIEKDTQNFVERFLAVDQFFPEVEDIEPKRLSGTIETARRRAASDADFIKTIYESFVREQNPDRGWPSPEGISENWAFFRWVQCQLLAALRLFQSYQGSLPLNPGNKFWTRAEHSMIDTYYLIFAALGGALASADNEMIEDFTLICPKGILVIPKGNHGRR